MHTCPLILGITLLCFARTVFAAPMWQPFPDGNGKFTPFDFTQPLHIDTTITESNGYGGLRYRYTTKITVKNDGILGHRGYGLYISRADQNFNDSAISVLENGQLLQRIFMPFQFKEQIHLDVVLNPNGSIVGSVSDANNSLDFTFPPRQIVANGPYFAYAYDVDTRAPQVVIPNFSFTELTVPEPSVFLTLPCLALLRRNRRT
jgi:hypothetical protein